MKPVSKRYAEFFPRYLAWRGRWERVYRNGQRVPARAQAHQYSYQLSRRTEADLRALVANVPPEEGTRCPMT